MEALVVKEDLRGGGIGTPLMSAMAKFGREPTHKIYEKLGCTEDARASGRIWIGGILR